MTVEPGAPGKKRTILVCLLLAVVVACALWQVFFCDFINLDDPSYVTGNSHIRNGLTSEGLRWAFRIGYGADWRSLTWMYWNPLTWISHMLDVQLFGLNPGWHHLTNLLLHIANTVLLFLVLLRMTKGFWQSAFVAALFGLHPLHVESVAWVAERKDVLSTFFWFLTIWAYARYVEGPRLARYLALLACFTLGLMSKPMLVTLPFALLLLDYWPLGRFRPEGPAVDMPQRQPKSAKDRKEKGKPAGRAAPQTEPPHEAWAGYSFRPARVIPLLREKVPLFAIALVSSIITYVAQQKGGAVESLDVLSLSARLANSFISYAVYIGKMFWPSGLAILYPHPGSWPAYYVVPAVLLFVAITAAVMWAGRKWPYLPSGWFWYCGTLVPVIGIVQAGLQARADRFTYIPLVGLFIIVAWGAPDALKTWRWRKQALTAASAGVLVCFFAATWVQVGYWKDDITVYNHALAVTAPSGLILNNRGSAYSKRGDYQRALKDFDKAAQISPAYADPLYNRGVVYNALGDYPRAMADFTEAIRINPQYEDAYNNRGIIRGAMGDYKGAMEDLAAAVSLNPQFAKAYYNRGLVRALAGDYKGAIGDYGRALEIDPGDAHVYGSRGAAYGGAGDCARAVSDFDRAVEIDPQYADAYYNRAMAYKCLGDGVRMLNDLRQAAAAGSEPAKSLLTRPAPGK